MAGATGARRPRYRAEIGNVRNVADILQPLGLALLGPATDQARTAA
jgi:hypothetical protein